MDQLDQNIDGNNNEQYYNSSKLIINNNYQNIVDQELDDQGITTDIFNYVLNNVKNKELDNNSKPTSLVFTKEKINLNFRNEDEQEEIKNYCKFNSKYIYLIEKIFSEFDSQNQNDVHSYILSRYSENIRINKLNNIENFYALYKDFIPKGKNKNPSYVCIAKSIVLFFFQDCTIFKKTEEENNQSKLDFKDDNSN